MQLVPIVSICIAMLYMLYMLYMNGLDSRIESKFEGTTSNIYLDKIAYPC